MVQETGFQSASAGGIGGPSQQRQHNMINAAEREPADGREHVWKMTLWRGALELENEVKGMLLEGQVTTETTAESCQLPTGEAAGYAVDGPNLLKSRMRHIRGSLCREQNATKKTHREWIPEHVADWSATRTRLGETAELGLRDETLRRSVVNMLMLQPL